MFPAAHSQKPSTVDQNIGQILLRGAQGYTVKVAQEQLTLKTHDVVTTQITMYKCRRCRGLLVACFQKLKPLFKQILQSVGDIPGQAGGNAGIQKHMARIDPVRRRPRVQTRQRLEAMASFRQSGKITTLQPYVILSPRPKSHPSTIRQLSRRHPPRWQNRHAGISQLSAKYQPRFQILWPHMPGRHSRYELIILISKNNIGADTYQIIVSSAEIEITSHLPHLPGKSVCIKRICRLVIGLHINILQKSE